MIYIIFGLALLIEFCAIVDYYLCNPEIEHRVLKGAASIFGVFALSFAILSLGL